MIDIRYRYVHEDVDRHGRVRVYFWRRPGPKIRMREVPGSAEFAARHAELMAAHAEGGQRTGPERPAAMAPGTLRWLVAQYVAAPTFRALDPDTQRVRRQILEHCCREPLHPGSDVTFASFPLDRLTTRALRVLRDRKQGLPEAANGRVKCLRALFRWAQIEHDTANPARDLERIRTGTTGFRAWTPDDVARFEARWPVGSKPRLALALLMMTGLRRSDVIALGRQHVREGWISIRLHKGRNSRPVLLEIPMLDELAEVIAASPCGDLTYLVTDYGRPFTSAGFGGWFRSKCDAAGCHGLSAHGLRKAAATIAAERGATPHQLMTLFGWSSLQQPDHYTRSANRRRLAAGSIGLIVPTSIGGENKAMKKP